MKKTIDLCQGWRFGGRQAGREAALPGFDDAGWTLVDIPHDWNARGGCGAGEFIKAVFWYRKALELTADEAALYNRGGAFLLFDAVGMAAEVFFNGEPAGGHKGGWSAFCADISGKCRPGKNVAAVMASNQDDPALAPLHGDFNRASGMNRPVRLVLTPAVHFDGSGCGYAGVTLAPVRAGGWNKDSNDIWQVEVAAHVTNRTQTSQTVTLRANISHPESFDHSLDKWFPAGQLRFDPADMCSPTGGTVGSARVTTTIPAGKTQEIRFCVKNIHAPKLWDGLTHPYQYKARVELAGEGTAPDSYETMIGFRYFEAVRKPGTYDDPENGFYLNGRPYPLRGMALHHDWPGLGRALLPAHIAVDIRALYEVGANWARISHYPHPELAYDILSRYGIACSAEIPLIDGVGMTGGKAAGKLDKAFKTNTLIQLREMILQLYNYPAILGWLLQNELGGGTYGQGLGEQAMAAQAEMVTALNNLAHELDPHRKTIMAMSLPHCYRYDADLLLWNHYPGWYSAARTGIGTFVDSFCDRDTQTPKRPTGVSEYGAGCNPYEHYDYTADAAAPEGAGDPWHPEEYANDRHEVSLREINARPFYWATAGWNLFDFSAAWRNEGGRKGINDKGLVRKERPADLPGGYNGDPATLLLRKDAFYLYKANWNPQPLCYIASRRYRPRLEKEITVTVYCNADAVRLFHNGSLSGETRKTARTDGRETGSCIFKFHLALEEGGNTVAAEGLDCAGNVTSSDTVNWTYDEATEAYLKSDVFFADNEKKTLALVGEGRAEDIYGLVFPQNPAAAVELEVLSRRRGAVRQGRIAAGMLLRVRANNRQRLYTFVTPYISAGKPITLDGAASAEIRAIADGNSNTAWEAADTEPHRIVVDLQNSYTISEIAVRWVGEAPSCQYSLWISADAKQWVAFAENGVNTQARYVGLDIGATQAGPPRKIAALAVYGWRLTVKPGAKITVDSAARLIYVPTDIPDYYQNGDMAGGLVFTSVGEQLFAQGNCKTAFSNETDYSLMETSSFLVTDSRGRQTRFGFRFVGGQ